MLYCLLHVFKHSEETSIKCINSAYLLGLPGLSWSIGIKYLLKDKAIELLEDSKHYILFQNSLQGGICQVFQRYAKRRYDSNGKSLSQILYLDVNGLYAYIMAECKLPYKLVDHKLEQMSYDYSKIKELSEDEDNTYFLLIDATVSELMIERNPALKYLPFFPIKINKKGIKNPNG